MCSIIDAIGNCFKTTVACVCFLLIGGPILIIVGSVLLKQPNDRALYNDAIKAFDPTPVKSMEGTINNVKTTIGQENLTIKGVDAAVSVFAQAFLPYTGSDFPSGYVVSVGVKNVKSFVRRVAGYQTKNRTFMCSSSSSKCFNDMEDFQKDCLTSGGNYVKLPCSKEFEFCASCIHYHLLSGVYLVLKEIAPGQFAEDPTLKSALYDFGTFANIYSATRPAGVDVRLYSSTDPRIALERHTKGTKSFGIDKRKAGIGMVVVGSILLLLEIVVCSLLVYFMCRRKTFSNAEGTENAMQNAHGAGPTNAYSNPPPNSFNPNYQNQKPGAAYGQPPAGQGYGYGHFPTGQGYGYGQPPTGQGYGYAQSPFGQGYGYGPQPLGRGAQRESNEK